MGRGGEGQDNVWCALSEAGGVCSGIGFVSHPLLPSLSPVSRAACGLTPPLTYIPCRLAEIARARFPAECAAPGAVEALLERILILTPDNSAELSQRLAVSLGSERVGFHRATLTFQE